MARLFCLDSVMIDVVLRVSALPPRSGDVLASERLITTGGGFNAMSAASRQGMTTLYAGRLGTGPFSDLARSALDAEGILAPVDTDNERDVGTCVVLVEPDGERTFVTSPGSEATLDRRHLESLDVESGDVVLVSGYNVMYPGQAELVLDWVSDLDDVTVAFDPATRMVDIPEHNLATMLERAQWLLCNRHEATALTGLGTPLEAAKELRERHGFGVVLRQGAQGCVVAAPGIEPLEVAGFLTRVVDLNGAGDVHNGAFLAELDRGADPVSAARWANAAAAVAVSFLGPASGPTREELDRWLAT
ncbi:MAG TPA: PfkB family carbohydrate kinase [Acidimicrobiales bacterium]|nr:PfkB family carbohydrate kinase [Acidimicrobiales bacterium]